MKGKRIFAYLALLCTLIALFIPLTAAADGCPPENPNCNIEPPQSIEVNPDPLQADGSPVELEEPGALSPQLIPMPLPRRVDPLPLPSQETAEILPIAMRYQDPEDATCGVQALGMAMSGLGEDAPSSAAIQAFLEGNGLMYDFGTGVEELAYAAQSLGYKGSLPFHGWTLEDLQAELSAGRPVVVSLGANPGQNTGTSGEGNPGHFVTVTGISGGQVAYNDPTLGKQVISTEEFLRLWSREGNSGVAVRREAPAGDSAGSAAWVAAGAALMALISQTPLALRRKGIGGRLDAGGVGAGRGPAPPGYRWVQRQTPKYEWQEVQEGWDMVPKTVPKMVRRYQQVGWTTMTERIPRYETERVQDGWTYTYERVPSYRTKRYIRYWRTEYTNQATFRYVGGRRVFAGYKRVARRVPVYGTRQVFAGYRTERKRVPRMVERRVLAGWDFVEKRVPKYDWVEEQDGWTVTTERIPRMVRKRVQVGTETRWVLARVPTPVPPRRPPTPTETPTQSPTPPGNEPEATETPMPPPEDFGRLPIGDSVPSEINMEEGFRTGLEGIGSIAAGAEIVRAGRQVSLLEEGGSLLIYGPRSARTNLGFNPYTNIIGSQNAERLLLSPAVRSMRSAVSGWTVVGLVTNIAIDSHLYAEGEYDRHEYASALTVDTGITIASALASGFIAGAVGGFVAGLGVASIPAAIVGGLVGAAAAFIGVLALERSGARGHLVDKVADLYAGRTRPFEGVATLASALADRASDAIESAVDKVGEAVAGAVDSVKSFFSGLFGNGS